MWYLTKDLFLKNDDIGASFDLPRKKLLIMQLLLENRNQLVIFDKLMEKAKLKSEGSLRSHIRQLQGMGLPLVVKGGVIFDEENKFGGK